MRVWTSLGKSKDTAHEHVVIWLLSDFKPIRGYCLLAFVYVLLFMSCIFPTAI